MDRVYAKAAQEPTRNFFSSREAKKASDERGKPEHEADPASSAPPGFVLAEPLEGWQRCREIDNGDDEVAQKCVRMLLPPTGKELAPKEHQNQARHDECQDGLDCFWGLHVDHCAVSLSDAFRVVGHKWGELRSPDRLAN